MRRILLILFILFIGSLGVAGYFFWQWHTLKNNPNAVTETQNQDLIEEVGRMILLPEGEQPTIATVTDPSKLADQQFFANAKTGDKVLVFSLAKKAILYDPVAHKIIEVGPVNVTENKSGEDAGGVVTEPKPEAKP